MTGASRCGRKVVHGERLRRVDMVGVFSVSQKLFVYITWNAAARTLYMALQRARDGGIVGADSDAAQQSTSSRLYSTRHPAAPETCSGRNMIFMNTTVRAASKDASSRFSTPMIALPHHLCGFRNEETGDAFSVLSAESRKAKTAVAWD